MAYKYCSLIQIGVQYKAILRIQTNIYKLQCMYLPHSTAMQWWFSACQIGSKFLCGIPPIAGEREKSLTLLLRQKYKEKIFFNLEEWGEY